MADGDKTEPVSYTYFFREADAMELVRDRLLVPARESGARPAIWCAGCATGEEAYSLAITASEAEVPVEIVATDIKPELVEEARRGRYSAHSLRHVSPDRRRRWFRPDGDQFEVVDQIRSAVSFRTHDVTGEAPPRPNWGRRRGWDAVFLRNVMLYVGESGKQEALTWVVPSLAPGGLFIIGASEWLSAKVRSETPAFRELRLEQVDGVVVFRRRRPDEEASEPPPRGSAVRSGGRGIPAKVHARAAPGGAPTGAAAPVWTELDGRGGRDAGSISFEVVPGRPEAARAPVAPSPADREAVAAVDEVEALRLEGDRLLDADHATEALAVYDRALAADELLADLHLRRALCLLRLSRPEEAHATLRRALFLEPGLWPAAWLLADLCQEVDPKAAIRYFSQARDILESGQADALVQLPQGSTLAPFLPGRKVALEAARVRLGALNQEPALATSSTGAAGRQPARSQS